MLTTSEIFLIVRGIENLQKSSINKMTVQGKDQTIYNLSPQFPADCRLMYY